MRVVQDIYDAYRIIPALQLHMLRVAGVAKLVSENLMEPADTESLVLAALFHDMGNIIKSDLSLFPEFLEPEGRAHWEMVKADFIRRYGDNAHRANVAIAKEIGLPARVVNLIDGIGFSNISSIGESEDREQKIVEYADLRVSPHGVVPLLSRLEEGKWRYESNHPGKTRHASEWEELKHFALSVEKLLFSDAALSPEDITEDAVKPFFGGFRSLPLPR